ncbi:MAG: hypothetical protein RLY86_1958 [Pseudomonadota bacterium]|jgi:predicted ATPase/signal transduction histidine kinase
MHAAAGYTFLEEAQADRVNVWWRAQRQSDGQRAVIRAPQPGSAVPREALAAEMGVLSALASPRFERPLGILETEAGPALVIADGGELFLGAMIPPAGMATDIALSIAMGLTEALVELHGRDYIHRDLRPANIRVDPVSGAVRLGGLGLVTRIPRETGAARALAMLGGELAFISPEQTGRMNRPVDHRADFYSLGVILHLMLTGNVPFLAQDPLGWVHRHIAATPIPVHELRPDLPAALSAVVLKLLAKTAEQRYHSAEGLRHDLEHCLSEWKATGTIRPFELGRKDRPARLMLPDALYGRDEPIARMMETFGRTTAGGRELLLVAGYSGIGKSALVRQIRRPVALAHGYYVEGKFEELQRDYPYLAIVQALRDLVRQILGEGRERLDRWRTRLTEVLGVNAGVVQDVVPELALVIGPQPPAPALPPVEAQNRFQLVMTRFIQQFAGPDHPLVLFLDDLQWADAGSFQLLTTLLSDASGANLLVIGAYRHNEVGPGHPVLRLADDIGQAAPVGTLMLGPLRDSEVGAWLAAACASSAEEVAPLARLLTQRSGGNPFFLLQLVTVLARDGWLRFDAEQGIWVADLAAIEKAGLTEDVANLLSSRLESLPEETRAALRVAASIGAGFDLSLLATALDAEEAGVEAVLQPALKEGLLIPSDDSGGAGGGAGRGFRFAHDRVQEACYRLTAEEERPDLHLRVGRLLRDRTRDSADPPLFDIVHNLNLARTLIIGPGERAELCRLNDRVAGKVQASAAYEIALRFVRVALELQDAIDDRRFRFDLLLKAAELSYLIGEHEGCEALLAEAGQLAASDLDRCAGLEISAKAALLRGDYAVCLRQVMAATRLLGLPLPERAVKLQLIVRALGFRRWLTEARFNHLAALPPMTDPHSLQTMRILEVGALASYHSGSHLFGILVFEGTRLSMRQGLARETAFCVAGCGLVFCALGDAATGHRLGSAACSGLGGAANQIEPQFIFSTFIAHYREHARKSIDRLETAFRNAMDRGNYQYGEFTVMGIVPFRLYAGADLRETQAVMTHACDLLRRKAAGHSLILFDHAAAAAALLAGNDWRAVEGMLAAELETARDYPKIGNLVSFCLIGMMLANVFGRPDLAVEQMALGRSMLTKRMGTFTAKSYAFHEALLRLSLLDRPDLAAADRKVHTKAVKGLLAQLKAWAKFAPMNHTHRIHLVEAELARQERRTTEAADLYSRAVEVAVEQGFVNDAALAAEKAAAFFARIRRPQLAGEFLRLAWSRYRDWGAAAKCRQLEETAPDALADLLQGQRRTAEAERPAEPVGPSQSLDLETVVRVAQAVSGELVLDRLIERLLDLAMENAGARMAALALNRGEGAAADLVVPALRGVDGAGFDVKPDRALADTDLPTPILNYVARTRDSVVLENASGSERFGSHPRWVGRGELSVLCTPIVHQGRLIGVLYLENDLAAGAFTPERVRLLQVLASQAAVALSNAQLFSQLDRARNELQAYSEQLEDMVAERTREVESRSRALEESLAELKRTQEQMLQTEKLASLGQLVAGVAHEVNTPIGILLSVASQFAEESRRIKTRMEEGALKRSDFNEFLQTTGDIARLMLHNAQRAADLVSSFKKVAADRTSDDMREIDLKDYTADVLATVEPLLRQKSVKLSLTGEDGIIMTTYPGLLAQLVTNLVQNAVVHAFDGVDTPEIGVDVVRGGDGQAVLSFVDNGTGMPPEVVARAFDPFFTTKRNKGGTGLGLHIVHNIVNGPLKGEIHLDSAPARGTRFTIRLPLVAVV